MIEKNCGKSHRVTCRYVLLFLKLWFMQASSTFSTTASEHTHPNRGWIDEGQLRNHSWLDPLQYPRRVSLEIVANTLKMIVWYTTEERLAIAPMSP